MAVSFTEAADITWPSSADASLVVAGEAPCNDASLAISIVQLVQVHLRKLNRSLSLSRASPRCTARASGAHDGLVPEEVHLEGEHRVIAE